MVEYKVVMMVVRAENGGRASGERITANHLVSTDANR